MNALEHCSSESLKLKKGKSKAHRSRKHLSIYFSVPITVVSELKIHQDDRQEAKGGAKFVGYFNTVRSFD